MTVRPSVPEIEKLSCVVIPDVWLLCSESASWDFYDDDVGGVGMKVTK